VKRSFWLLGVGPLLGGADASCTREAMPPPSLSMVTPAAPVVRAEEIRGTLAEEAPSAEALAALASRVAPGMREAVRGESPLPASIAIPAAETDVCLRAAFEASSPVVAAVVDGRGRVLDLSVAGKETLLDNGGPVCLRKNYAAHLEVQGAGGTVRYVVWMTP
jgi:hypothetical protein